MIKFFKENRLSIIFSSIVTLLPAILGFIFKEQLPNSENIFNDTGIKTFSLFIMPVILLFVHIFCLAMTSTDNTNQNKKALRIVFWIIPFTSIMTSFLSYALALDKKLNISFIVATITGILFIITGNYLPKTKQNSSLGIKLKWTLGDEENWNKTHRFGGKVWVIGGIILLIALPLPARILFTFIFWDILAMVIIPTIYSYIEYRKNPIVLVPRPYQKYRTIYIFVILAGILILMFTGNISFSFNDTSFNIKATYYSDLEVKYDDIDSIEYRENLDFGIRTNGFGSPRLCMGTFTNDEFGNYTRYCYTGDISCIIIKNNDNVLVIGDKTNEKTKELYEKLKSEIER